MVYSFAVYVNHSPDNIFGKGESEIPVEGNVIIQKHIIQAAFSAIFSYNGQVRVINRASNELAQINMIELPEQY